MTFASALKPKLIYVFRINDAAHQGCLKIGETTITDGDPAKLDPNCEELNKAARARIDQYTRTAGIEYELLYTEGTMFSDSQGVTSFSDRDVHDVLLRSGVKKKVFDRQRGANEWFSTDLATAKLAIAAVKEGRRSLPASEVTQTQSPIVFRPEQRAAIDKTKKHLAKKQTMLWDAKMRFGKTLTALQVVKDMKYRRTLIMTHRPVVDDGWFEDFGQIFHKSDGFLYGSRDNGEKLATLEKSKQNYIYFASIQDLRGAETVGGKFDKHQLTYQIPWDFIIVDEAHEGYLSPLGQAVDKALTRPATKKLLLSGTAFNLFDLVPDPDGVYSWTYTDEQRAKQEWDATHFGDPNPYASLPAMNIYTYDLGRLLSDYIDEEVAFNFREFFRVIPGTERFVHEADVRAFLHLLCRDNPESVYPFSCPRFRDTFRHTLWMVPGVREALALQRLLEDHPVFSQFDVVNVAGDGDPLDPDKNLEAMAKLRRAIGPDAEQTRTITLSCGRLTTGVTVPEWTGILMLKGTYITGAKEYMQTIFRVQSPWTVNGRTKTDAYVFDFAPDRTLKVLAEAAKAGAARRSDGDDRQALGRFLNFCPVIGISGSRMRPFDVDAMLRQLKKVYIEQVVRNGFADGDLYNDQLLKLDAVDLSAFADLRRVIGHTQALPKTDSVDVNAQGLTGEEREEKEKLQKKKKRERTPEQKQRLEELKNKETNRQAAISILRVISIRMPLLMYGADIPEGTEITLSNFTSLVDDLSWQEFMPRGVTKQKFNDFRRYYDPDIFAAAARRIRDLARAADRVGIEERIERIAQIFSTFRNPDKETVLTPWRVVNMHLSDTLGGFCFFSPSFPGEPDLREPRFVERGDVTAQVFNPDTRILEINSKTGLYPLYVAYSAYRARLASLTSSVMTVDEQWEQWAKTVSENIFVICKTPMARSITRRTLVGFRPISVNTRYVEELVNQIKTEPQNLVARVGRGRTFWQANTNDNMKFNAIVGNPPYQIESESTRKAPIYHLFYNIAFQIAPKVTLITPGRFLFRAGQTPQDWMDKILSNPHFKVVKYFQKSTEVFPSVDIKGGVVISYYDKQQNFKPVGIFTSFPQLTSILNKIKCHAGFKEGEFMKLISSQGLYRFTQKFFDDFPVALTVQGEGTKSKITSNSLESLPDAFLNSQPEDAADYIKILGRSGGQREFRWIKKQYIQTTGGYCESYNVFVPEANGTGAIGEVLSSPIIGSPIIGHTDTFISIGKFATEAEADACLKYVKTKFARTLLGVLKATQHNPRDTWRFVPLQEFTAASDIDWSRPVADIDRQLYAKYGLDSDEIAFIESMIKPM